MVEMYIGIFDNFHILDFTISEIPYKIKLSGKEGAWSRKAPAGPI
jgi:hypothetical protein